MNVVFETLRRFFANDVVQFALICLSIVAALILLAWLVEHFLCKNRLRLSSPKYLTTVAVSAALASVLMLLEIPLLFLVPSMYKLDFSELPVLICSFYLGPAAGVLTEFLKILLKLLFKQTTTAMVGELANFLVGCSLVLPASIIYHLKRSKKNAILGLITGTVVMTAFGSLFNAFYLLPTFAKMFGLPLDSIIGMGTAINHRITNLTTFVLFSVAPLNLIKGTTVSILSMLLYKRTEVVMFKRF